MSCTPGARVTRNRTREAARQDDPAAHDAVSRSTRAPQSDENGSRVPQGTPRETNAAKLERETA